jgi:lysophospholipase L1-like esterase
VRIVLAGDSTVTDKAGWGTGFTKHLAEDAECINLSRGGRSSMSFIKEGIWAQCLALKPDYVLIQFGHNDQKLEDPKRGTKPQEGYRQYMTQYIDDARAAGIKPIIVTSMSRRQFNASGKIESTLTPYVDVAKTIAKEKDVPVIDLHARSIELYEKLGKSGCENTISPKKEDGSIDNTHLNAKGAELIAPLVIVELKRAAAELADHFK